MWTEKSEWSTKKKKERKNRLWNLLIAKRVECWFGLGAVAMCQYFHCLTILLSSNVGGWQLISGGFVVRLKQFHASPFGRAFLWGAIFIWEHFVSLFLVILVYNVFRFGVVFIALRSFLAANLTFDFFLLLILPLLLLFSSVARIFFVYQRLYFFSFFHSIDIFFVRIAF